MNRKLIETVLILVLACSPIMLSAAEKNAPVSSLPKGVQNQKTSTPVSTVRGLYNTSRSTVKQENDSQVWNLKDVDLRTLAHEVSKVTGKNFVIGPKVDDKVSFITSYRLSKDELYEAFVALLHAYGYAAVPEGSVVKIVPSSSKNQLRPDLHKKNGSEREKIVLRTIRVENYPVTDLVKIIDPLIPKYSYVQAYKPSNDLIIADYGQHVNKIIELVKRLDRPSTKDFDVIRLRYGTADELAKTLTTLMATGKTGLPTTIKIAAEPRSNALIVSGARFGQLKELHKMIRRLDLPDDAAHERTEVIYLHYLTAETFAPIVQGLVESYIVQEEAKTGKQSPTREINIGTTSVTGAQRRSPSLSGQFNLRNPLSNFSSGSGADSLVNTGGGLGTYTSEPPRSGFLGQHVQWEESTNSVIVSAPSAVLRRIRSVVKQLDIRRPQVLIEVIVAEIDVDRVAELGIEWGDFNGKKQFNTRFPTRLPLSGIGDNGNYSTLGIPDTIGTGMTIGIFHGMTLHFLARALATNNDTNILATPNLVTLDNQPALIKVGRKVSFTIGQIDNNPTGGNPFNSFEREDVGLILSVRPMITPDGSIRLDITQEISNLINGTEAVRAGQNPDTTERFIQTTVMADNDQIIVLGGLLQKEWQQVVDKVPIIGDIPVLGLMFRNHYKQMRKTNLMVFLHPVIMIGPKDASIESNGKYEYLRQSQMHLDKYRERGLKMNPVAPILHQPVSLPEPFCDVNKPHCWGLKVQRGYPLYHGHKKYGHG